MANYTSKQAEGVFFYSRLQVCFKRF